MLFKQDIANLALGHLGTSLGVLDYDNELTPQAKIIRRNFRTSLDKMLAKHPWGFATPYAVLPLLAEAPIAGWSFAYALPADCQILRMIAPDGAFPKVKLYQQEQMKFKNVYNGVGPRIVYTDIPRAHGEYTVRLPEDFAFPVHFGAGLAYQLALDIGPSLVTNNFPKVQQALMVAARNSISEAIATDMDMEPQQQDAPCSFISARRA